jgi:hypothetical protein
MVTFQLDGTVGFKEMLRGAELEMRLVDEQIAPS